MFAPRGVHGRPDKKGESSGITGCIASEKVSTRFFGVVCINSAGLSKKKLSLPRYASS